MRKNVLLSSFIACFFTASMLPTASAIVIADAAGDYVAAASATTAPTAFPSGWSYLYSTAASGGTEVALTAETALGNAGNTGFAGIDTQFGTAAVLGTLTEDPVDNLDYQFEIFSDGFDGNPTNANVNEGNEAVVGTDLLLHPGRAETEDEPPVPIDPVVIARYTIQAGDLSAGTSATIAGSFRDLAGRANAAPSHGSSESVMVEVLHNGSSLFNATGGATAAGTTGHLLQATGTFNLTGITLALGDTIDFTVNNNGNFGGDATALQAIIDIESTGGLPGDFNNDTKVDGADFLEWQRDNNVGSLTDWQNNYGNGVSGIASINAVPEPSSLLLAMWAAAICGFRRR
ncbi:hypothetical protein [Adhaeretor mobilis]|uniref:PEP-CTERM protein-sorting domain-containing protein n=1 Tax=Adhaeretor mobilis TaxID=1930276 RepID=A0A517MU59_9BACT|nr:hypothetical protein [Adhaeretor mobilis]QDS98418.1 hypothetical protein HG15A2_16940 [Adhaeretor mobilis]